MALITGAGITAAMAVGLPAAAGAATAAPMDLPSGCSLSVSTVTCTYTYTGGEQDFAVPAYVSTVDVTAVGAAGGSDSTVHAGGTAEQAHAVLSVTPGATLDVEVGGPGLDTSAATNAPGPAGGFNGGGAGSGGDNSSISSASGGGASDVRTSVGSLASRLIVAGGGGGASSCGAGGDAGEPGQGSQPCQTSNTGGGAGTTTMGGAANYPAAPGVQGVGGNGGYQAAQGSDTANLGGGGGGGGYYGGGGGGPTAGGGGGSSYVPPGAMNTITPTAWAASVIISYPAAMLSIATHQNITVDATSPAGAVVHYTAPAVTDEANPTDPPAVCVPPSGSTFAIGTTTVTCTATDVADDNSPVSTTFTVHVVGAPGQLAALHWDVRGYGPGLANTVLIAEHAVDTGNTPRACLALDAFIIEVQTRIPPLPPIARAYLIAAAAQIQAVLACGDSWLP